MICSHGAVGSAPEEQLVRLFNAVWQPLVHDLSAIPCFNSEQKGVHDVTYAFLDFIGVPLLSELSKLQKHHPLISTHDSSSLN